MFNGFLGLVIRSIWVCMFFDFVVSIVFFILCIVGIYVWVLVGWIGIGMILFWNNDVKLSYFII